MKLENFKEQTIYNVDSVGYMSIEEGVMEYFPLLHTIYFQFEGGYYQFHVNEYDLTLVLKAVEKIDYSYDICEEAVYARSTIREIAMPDTCMSDTRIEKIEFYNMERLEDRIICNACEITFMRDVKLFLDPTWLCGINIGGEDVKKRFFDDFSKPVDITVVE